MKKRKIYWIIILIIILQSIARIYIGNYKSYFHMDEAYSYGLMNYNKLNIADNSDFLNTWHNKEYYLDYITVSNNEKWDLKPVYENQKNDVHPPFYYFCLRLFANFSINKFSKWTGLALNLVVFLISNIFVYKISKLLFKNPIFCVFAILFNGFSVISLNSFSYIRMYELCNLFVLVLTYLHLKLIKLKEIKTSDILILIIILVLGGLTHYYFFIFAFVLWVIVSFKYIRNKKYKNLLKYEIAVFISAMIFLLIFPHAIEDIFFSYRGIMQKSGINLMKKIFMYLVTIDGQFLNYLFIPVFLITLLIGVKRKIFKKILDYKLAIILIPSIVYIIAVIMQSPYIEFRYIIPIYSVFCLSIIYILKQLYFKWFKKTEAIFLIFFIIFMVLYSPLFIKPYTPFLYRENKKIVENIHNQNIPIVYVFNSSNNRFLDDIYLFTLIDKSIILEENRMDVLEDIIEAEGEFFIICNDGVDESKVKNLIEKKYDYIKRLNAANVYKYNRRNILRE